jgi:hypothetical protein
VSTNYYWVEQVCPTCSHGKERWHIGKYTGGGFIFHALRAHESPTGKEVKTWKCWQDIFEREGAIRSEYGETLAAPEFASMVRECLWATKKRARLEGVTGVYDAVDEHGFGFHFGEFF